MGTTVDMSGFFIPLSFNAPIAVVGLAVVVMALFAPRRRRGLLVTAGALIVLDAVIGTAWVALQFWGVGGLDAIQTGNLLQSVAGSLLWCGAIVLMLIAAARRTGPHARAGAPPSGGSAWQAPPPRPSQPH